MANGPDDIIRRSCICEIKLFGVRCLKRAFLFLALLGAFALAGCGGNGDTTSQTTYNNGSGDQPYKPVTHLSHRAIISNYYAGNLAVMDATQNRLTTYTFAAGSEPTYLQSSPDGTLTLVNDTGSQAISSLNNQQESVKATVILSGFTESFVSSQNNKFGFAAVPNYNNGSYRTPGAIVRFNPTDGSLNTQIQFPSVHYLGMDGLEKHLMAFTDTDYLPYWVDLTAEDPSTGVPAYYQLSLKNTLAATVTLSQPRKVFFSSDSTKAYILSCGTECGGPGSAKVTVVDLTSITVPATPTTGAILSATVLGEWTVKGAQAGYMDTTNNVLYLAGSTGASSVDSGGNTVLDGWFTELSLSSLTNTPTVIAIGPGNKRIIRNIKGTWWIGAQNCGVVTCITTVSSSLGSATPLPQPAHGNATGITLAANTGDVYTIEGGEFYMYSQAGATITSQYNTDVKGQAYDVLYIN